jgi:hypothetical protein
MARGDGRLAPCGGGGGGGGWSAASRKTQCAADSLPQPDSPTARLAGVPISNPTHRQAVCGVGAAAGCVRHLDASVWRPALPAFATRDARGGHTHTHTARVGWRTSTRSEELLQPSSRAALTPVSASPCCGEPHCKWGSAARRQSLPGAAVRRPAGARARPQKGGRATTWRLSCCCCCAAACCCW